MFFSAVLLALSALSASAEPPITPPQSAPVDCEPSFSGPFAIAPVNISVTPAGSPATPGGYGGTSGPSPLPTACDSPSTLSLTLSGGILLTNQERTGNIAPNHQLQFDNPLQAGAIYTGGFSACANGSLALGGSTVFYSCVSGAFTNIFDISLGSQCAPVGIAIEPLINC